MLDLEDLDSLKRKYRIHPLLWDCHTAFVGDYFIEGHVPFEAVQRLLEERPDILGLALPGMPTGTPGMPGPKEGPFVVLQVNKDGTYQEYARY